MRFAVLHHTGWPGHTDHYDLLLQQAEGRDDNDRVLKAYTTLEDIFPAAGSLLRANEDHRRLYLDYEGPVSSGRGNVRRIDSGPIQWDSTAEQLRFTIGGTKLSGTYLLKSKQSSLYVLEILSAT